MVLFVQELRDAALAGNPVVLVVFAQEKSGRMGPADFAFMDAYFGRSGLVSELASRCVTLRMNRLCPCWKKAPWRANGPMIVLFDREGETVLRVTDSRYDYSELARRIGALLE